MSGRSDEEINAQIEKMKAEFLLKNPFGNGEEIIFIHNFKEMEVTTNTYDPILVLGERKTPALYYLGRAINKMAYCDGVYFGKGWSKARGCMIEMEVCVKYDIPYFINRKDGVICKVIDDFKEESDETDNS
jgi:hypothetical protein